MGEGVRSRNKDVSFSRQAPFLSFHLRHLNTLYTHTHTHTHTHTQPLALRTRWEEWGQRYSGILSAVKVFLEC
jgi:hypothetical protein